MKETTFEEIISADWTKDKEDFGLILVETDSGVSGAVGEFMLIWDEIYPISQSLSDEDCAKMYNLLINAGKMFRLLRNIDIPEAKELIKKIEQSE
jgi:hypothetical protein